MAAIYDNYSSGRGFGVTTLATSAFTIGAGANRAAWLVLIGSADPGAVTAVSCGGQSGSVLANTTNNGQLYFTTARVIAPATGSQTASMTWTNSMGDVTLIVITATGVDQAIPMDGGNFTLGGYVSTPTTTSCTITSTSGDLTVTVCGNSSGASTEATNRTIIANFVSYAAGDYGPGTGTTAHTWHDTTASGDTIIVGANFKAAGGGLSIPVALRINEKY